MSSSDDPAVPPISELGRGLLLYSDPVDEMYPHVPCWNLLLYRDRVGWICGLSHGPENAPPATFDGLPPRRIQTGDELFAYIRQAQKQLLLGALGPLSWKFLHGRLAGFDAALGVAFARAMNSDRSLKSKRKTAAGRRSPRGRAKATEELPDLDAALVDPAEIEGCLSDLTSWSLRSKQALVALHRFAREEFARRRGTPDARGRFEELERRLFGRPEDHMSEHERCGTGFHASLMDGTGPSLFRIAGVDAAEEIEERIWQSYNWHSVLASCDEAFLVKLGEQDDRPGMSDEFFWVVVDEPAELARQLREFFVRHA